MTSINEKLGLKRAGKRSMMKLPDDRALRAKVTAAKCPSCGLTGATLSKVRPGYVFCTWCSHAWPLNEETEAS